MTLDRLLADPQWRVSGLLTTLDRSSDRVAMHDVRGPVVRAQAEALGLPLIEMPIEWPAPNTAYEDALALALEAARSVNPNLDHMAFGDLFLADIREWRESSLARFGWSAEFPLWNEPTRNLATEFIGRGHRARVTTVDLEQLDASFCGREFNEQLLAQLPETVDPCGENGEFHTLCHASPLFSLDLDLVRVGTHVLHDRFRCADFTLA